MKKLNERQIKVLEILILLITIVALIITLLGLVKTIKSKKTIKTSNFEEIEKNNLQQEINDNIEENIEENIENKIQTNNQTESINSTSAYYIKVNYGANVVTIYTKDIEGNYTVPYRAMICSTGRGTPRSGVYPIKSRWTWGTLFGNVYGYYCIHIVGNILFHSVPYLTKGDPSSIEYWEYDKLGTSASAGCIRLTLADVKWIYNNVPSGTLVEFYSSSDPGPLGKPTAKKISDNIECRGWDPTDTNDDNPWRAYFNAVEEKKENNNIVENTIIDNDNIVINNSTDENQTINNVISNNTNQTVNNTVTNETINNEVINNTVKPETDNSVINNINEIEK